jgi:hypothetical protein
MLNDDGFGPGQSVSDRNRFQIRVPLKDQFVDRLPQDDPAKHIQAVVKPGIEALPHMQEQGQ